MRMSWKLGRVAGTDLYLHWTFLLLLAYWATWGLEWAMLVSAVFGCVLLHELGHALAARAFGIPTEDITLYPIGGVARLRRLPRAPGAELVIALAGPLVNVLIVGVLVSALWLGGAYDPWSFDSLVTSFVKTLVGYNIVLAVFNLIPAFPMDGGRVLRALLSGWMGRVRATEVAAQVGKVLALAFGLFCFFLGPSYWLQATLAAFIFLAANAELQQVYREERRYRPYDRHNDGDGGFWVAPPGYRWVSRGNGVWQLAPIIVPAEERPYYRSWP
ncbi:MAG: site-2 protease family protein [Isosphaeraceae bacterium]|nr:site-2 protease family protein [Isosphaeraceae bacterium]